MARQRNLATRSDINKQGWQQAQFPIACQTCYGTSPYMRMLKQKYGQQCRICFRPFSVFKWKVDHGRYKRTAICNNCGKTKNLCQTCLKDLEFGLPMEVRDRRCGDNGKAILEKQVTEIEGKKKNKPPPPKGLPPPLDEEKKKEEIIVLPPSTIYEEESD